MIPFCNLRHVRIGLVCLFLSFLFSQNVFAACSESNATGIATGSQGLMVGQSFTMSLCSSGNFTSIQVTSNTNNSNATLRIYQGAGFGGTELHSQSSVSISIGGNTINLSSNVAFTNGQTYTFSLEVGGGFLDLTRNSTGMNVYGGGTLFDANGMSVANDDLVFVVNTDALVLPVELSKFEATKRDNSIVLDWETATEVENEGFEIQRSANAQYWESIAFVEGRSYSNGALMYQFVDRNPLQGSNYYRLKQIDYDGQLVFSQIRNVLFNESPDRVDLKIYPNPVSAGSFLNIQVFDDSVESIFLTDLMGKMILQENSNDFSQQINIPNNLPKGAYFIIVKTTGNRMMKKIMVQ